MRIPGLMLSGLLSVMMLAAPMAEAQTRPNTSPNTVTTYVRPLQVAEACVDSQPASALKPPGRILSELMAASDIPSGMVRNIRVVESNQLNAATNGRDIILTSAMLNRLDTNGERAFVIGHELAHVVLDHVARTQVRHIGWNLLDRFLVRRYVSQGTLADLAADLGIGLIDRKFSRDYEYQADDVGMKLMVNAGYPACSALEVFETLQAARSGNRLPEFLQSHPLTESRVEALVKKYQLQSGSR